MSVHVYFGTFTTYQVNIAGADIGFAGAIWADRPHLQVLTPTLPLFYRPSDEDMRIKTARYLGATKKAVSALKDCYEFDLPHITTQSEYHLNLWIVTLWTIPRSIDLNTCLSSTRTDAYIVAPCNDKICIKFVNRYAKETHLKCLSLRFARGFDRIPDG